LTDVQGPAKRRHNKSPGQGGGVTSKKYRLHTHGRQFWAHISHSMVSYWADDVTTASIYITTNIRRAFVCFFAKKICLSFFLAIKAVFPQQGSKRSQRFTDCRKHAVAPCDHDIVTKDPSLFTNTCAGIERIVLLDFIHRLVSQKIEE